MTLAGWAAIGGIVLTFATITSMFGALLMRGIKAWSSIDRKLLMMEQSMNYHVETAAKTMQAIQEAVTADRIATNERLRFLEQHVWSTTGRSQHAGTT